MTYSGSENELKATYGGSHLETMEAPNDMMAQDLKESVEVLTDFVHQADTTVTSIRDLLERVKNGEFETSKGITFLELKYQMLLSYLVNLTYLIHRKSVGQKIEGEKAIERLVEIRTVLEKMRPIDQKLKYQIDKLLQASTAGVINPDDPLYLRANLNNTCNKLSEEEISQEESDVNEDKEKIKNKIYVPPKVSAMHYDGDDTAQERRQKLLEKARKRALSSTIMEELRQEYDEGPEEIYDAVDLQKAKHKREMKELQDYEEEFMTRMPLSKKQKHNSKQLSTISSLQKLARYGDLTALDADVDNFPLKKKNRGKKQSKKKGKKKGFHRRKH